MTSFETDGPMKVNVILNSRDDWYNWISYIRAYAERLDVWDHFDPEDPIPPAARPRVPMKPQRPAAQDLTDLICRVYQLDFEEYKDSRDNIAKVEETIMTSIGLHVHPVIREKRRFEVLKALKLQYEPSLKEMKDKVLGQYQAVMKRSPQKGKIKSWIEDFDHAYLAIKEYDLPESKDCWVQLDFLRSIERVNPSFSSMKYSSVGKTTYTALVRGFRAHLANSGQE